MWTGADLWLAEDWKNGWNLRELYFAPIHAERWTMCRSAFHIRKAPELLVHKNKSSSASNRLHKPLYPIGFKGAVLEQMHMITTFSPITNALQRSKSCVLSFLLDLMRKPDQWWAKRSNSLCFYSLLGVRNCIWVQEIATGSKNGLHFPGMSRISLLSTTPRLALKPIRLPVK